MPIEDFTRDALPGRVVFGVGAVARTADEIVKLGIERALLIHEDFCADVADRIAEGLGDCCVGRFTDIHQHVPTEMAAGAVAAVREADADGLVTVGGGTTVGFAKAVALELPVTIAAVPMTYAGSEMTPIWGMTTDARKTTGRDLAVLPSLVVYDPELTVGMPPFLTGTSGLNALAHAVEGFYAPGADPVTSVIAEEAVAALGRGLPRAVASGDDLDGRADVQYGAHLAAVTLAHAGTSVHHKICHALGGAYDLPHAPLHATVLPYALAGIADRVPTAVDRVARALEVDDGVQGLFDLQAKVGAPTGLAEIGMRESDLDEGAAIAAAATPATGIPVDEAEMRQILDDAFHGRRP